MLRRRSPDIRLSLSNKTFEKMCSLADMLSCPGRFQLHARRETQGTEFYLRRRIREPDMCSAADVREGPAPSERTSASHLAQKHLRGRYFSSAQSVIFKTFFFFPHLCVFTGFFFLPSASFQSIVFRTDTVSSFQQDGTWKERVVKFLWLNRQSAT